MASDPGFVEYVRDQVAGAGSVSTRKMFGDYALYCDGKVVALICDNQLFVKPTEAGKQWAGETSEVPPYSGAKPHFLINERLDDGPWITQLIRITHGALPAPKQKKPKARNKT